MMRNVYSLTEKVQGIASKGKKLSREFKEYFRSVGVETDAGKPPRHRACETLPILIFLIRCISTITTTSATYSGDWETLLLRATRPDDKRPDSKYIRMVLDASSHFIRDEDVTSSNNPFRVTLRKLWAKMAEKDWRTTLKALLLFHILFRLVEKRLAYCCFLLMVNEGCRGLEQEGQ